MKYNQLVSIPVFVSGEEGYAFFRIPTVLSLPGGKVLAFAEGRKTSMSDTGEIDIVQKISYDGGRTFGELKVAVAGISGTAGNQCPVYDRDTGKVLLVYNRNDGNIKEKMILRGVGERTVHVVESGDMGETWSPERDITAQTRLPDWTWYACGPCHAVQMPSGRIVVPCNHGLIDLETKTPLGYVSHVIYSDDHGENWHIGANIHEGTNECTLVCRADGALSINMRNIPHCGCRTLAVSHDGGVSFSGFHRDEELAEPCCQGSMLPFETEKGEMLLFSNPSHSSERLNMSIHESYDGGETWQMGLVVDEGISAYSDMTSPESGKLGILYEGGSSIYERIIWKLYQLEV